MKGLIPETTDTHTHTPTHISRVSRRESDAHTAHGRVPEDGSYPSSDDSDDLDQQHTR